MAEIRTLAHEPDVPRVRPLLVGGAAILGVVIATVIAAVLIVQGLASPRGVPQGSTLRSAAPALQPDPERDFPAFHQEKLELLESYAWVDRAHGVVRIPIERAMTLLVEQQSSRRSTP
jgi:hypothetical protein